MTLTLKLGRLTRCALAAGLLMAAAPTQAASLTSAPFGKLADGRAVTRYTMTARSGVRVTFMSYGGTVTDVTAPNRWGRLAPIALSFPTLRDYETQSGPSGLYFGALIGRYANFIAGGRFTLDGHVYRLYQNYPPNSLHGGRKGFDQRLWRVQPTATTGPSVSAQLTYTSPDGEEGYPGTLKVTVTYSLSDAGAFTIEYRAVTDKATVVALTNHLSLNLAGVGAPAGVLEHELTLNADRYLPTDQTQIPLGPLASVQGTPFDFRRPTPFGARIRARNAQLAIAGGGYDQEWVLNKHGDTTSPQWAARIYEPISGRTLECLTTEPGVLSYTANSLRGFPTATGGPYRPYAAFTLETQHFPDSPNHPAFPTTVLRPGQVYRSTTIFRFGVR